MKKLTDKMKDDLGTQNDRPEVNRNLIEIDVRPSIQKNIFGAEDLFKLKNTAMKMNRRKGYI